VPADETTAISVRGVVRRFGLKTALARVDLAVAPGQVHALLGPNGAGKTTLTRILCGLVDPDEGQVQTAGAVALVPSGDRSFYLRIGGLENLIFFARLHGMRLRVARDRALQALDQVGLAEAANVPVGRYSHGMQKRLSVARALLTNPKVLLVDEATHDLDPEGATRIRGLVTDLARRGAAVLWTTQRIEEIRGFAHAVTFLHQGKVGFMGSVGDLIALAPHQRYVVRVRNGNPDRPPDAHVLQTAVGTVACLSDAGGAQGEFLLTPTDGRFGSAIAALATAGYEVMTCRQERAEIEDAFLALATREAS
jgi:ABC-type multidrug transport system ATPase subunit